MIVFMNKKKKKGIQRVSGHWSDYFWFIIVDTLTNDMSVVILKDHIEKMRLDFSYDFEHVI